MMINRHYKSTEFITGLRAIAVMMVFLIHSGGAGLREFGHIGNKIVDFGQYGVEIFFVISGYTIFYQIFYKKYTMKDFIIIRLFRISIPYFPIVILLFILSQFGFTYPNNWVIELNKGLIDFQNLLVHLFYISFINIKYANSIIGVEWTLSIEVFYYLLIAIMIFKMSCLSNSKSIFLVLISFFLFAIFSLIVFKKFHFNNLYIHWLPLKYGYMFILGGLSFFLREKLEKQFSQQFLHKISNVSIILIPSVITLFITTDKMASIGIVNELFFATITFFLIVFVRDSATLTRLLTNKIMVFFGSISFSFYLIHLIVITLLKYYWNITLEEMFIVSLCIAVIISFIWYIIFENKIYRSVKKYYLGISK